MQRIDREDFVTLISPLLGLPVSHPWRGYGSSIFLELGDLQPPDYPHLSQPNGEACIVVDCEWRVSDNDKILFGSSNSGPQIDKALSRLSGLLIKKMDLFATPPELSVGFSNGNTLQSMAMVSGRPRWSIKIPDGNYLFYENSSFVRAAGDEPLGVLTEEENEIMNWADKTASRWGKPSVEPKLGDCVNCRYFVQLDGEFDFLDYGICTIPDGPLDGHAVNVSSGCPKHIERPNHRMQPTPYSRG